MTWSTVVSLLRTTLYGWAVSLWRFLRLLWRLLHRRPKGEHRPPAPTGCIPVDHPALVRPDPLLYSERYLRDRGLAVTWNNFLEAPVIAMPVHLSFLGFGVGTEPIPSPAPPSTSVVLSIENDKTHRPVHGRAIVS